MICSLLGRQIKNKICLFKGSIFLGQSKHSLELKLHILQLFEEGQYSISELCEKFSVNDQTLYS